MKRIAVISLLFIGFLHGLNAQDYLKPSRVPVSTLAYWERAAVPYQDGIVYISNKPIPSMTRIQDTERRLLSNIYMASKIDGKWKQEKLFSETFHSDYDDGPVCFARDYQMICLARAYEAETGDAGRNSNGNSGLYFSTYSDGNWSSPEPYQHNDPAYIYYTPFLTNSGDTLYFAASNIEDSRGGYDIYVSHMKNGDWSVPENVGDMVNTAADELYPFLHRKTGRLYFSSNGHDNFGTDWDIFYCSPNNNSWNAAVKLPSPINSRSNEYAIVLNDDFTEGYFERKVGSTTDIYELSSDFPDLGFPRPIKKNRFCFRLRENSLDTIDYTIFDYEWVINDTLHLPGHSVKYCFPGPGEYFMSFNVTNKITDTVMYDQANLYLNLELVEQPVITCPDTIVVGRSTSFSGFETNLPMEIEDYYWDFGDGGKTSGEVVKYTFSSPGKYSVQMGAQEKVRNRGEVPRIVTVFKEVVVIPAQ